MWPARTLKHPLHRPWGYLRIECFHGATLVSGSREPKAVNPCTSGCDHGDGASSCAQAKKGAGGFHHLPPRPPLCFYPSSHHLIPNRHFPSLSSLLPRARKVSRRCWRRRWWRDGGDDGDCGFDDFFDKDSPPFISTHDCKFKHHDISSTILLLGLDLWLVLLRSVPVVGL
jgi:hypothetical protein